MAGSLSVTGEERSPSRRVVRSAGVFAPFQYVPSVQSMGDCYTLTLSFPDDATLLRVLAPLGLAVAAQLKLGDEYVDANGLGMWVEAFGPSIALRVGPEDASEHCRPADHAAVAELARALRDAGAERFVMAPFAPVGRGAFTATFSPAHARLNQLDAAVYQRKRTGEPAPVVNEPANERYRALFDALSIPLPEVDESEASLATRIVVAKDGLSPRTLTTPMAIVAAALTYLRDHHLPCFFDARSAVENDDPELFASMIAQLNASLEGHFRSFAPFGLAPDADTFVCLSDADRALLAGRSWMVTFDA